ncbi:MAG: hypothetical protein RLZ91_1479, partial [Bacteroidota bacterium]
IYDRLCKKNNDIELIRTTDEHIQQFSSEGLRCLLLTCKTIPQQEYLDWEANYIAAKANLSEIENKKKGLPNQIEMLENGVGVEGGQFDASGYLGVVGIVFQPSPGHGFRQNQVFHKHARLTIRRLNVF